MRRFFLSQLDGEATASTLTTVFFSEQNKREKIREKLSAVQRYVFMSQKESVHLDKKQFYELHLTIRRIVDFIIMSFKNISPV